MIVKIKEFDLKGEFANFFADFHTAKAETMHVYLNIYTNAEGTTFALDGAGNPITDRLINYVIYTLPVSNEAQSIYTAGYMTIHFHDGNDFKHRHQTLYLERGLFIPWRDRCQRRHSRGRLFEWPSAS